VVDDEETSDRAPGGRAQPERAGQRRLRSSALFVVLAPHPAPFFSLIARVLLIST
jgi:hypothetical protein